MILGIDVDDVLAQFVPRYREICRLLYAKPPKGTEPTDWDFSNFGMTKDQHETVWRLICGTENFHMTLERAPDTWQLDNLDRDHTLFFITSRKKAIGKRTEVQTALWLESKYRLDHPVVILTNDKATACNLLGVEAFIDDSAAHCNAVAAARPSCRVFIKNRPYNKPSDTLTVLDSIERVENLNEFADRISKPRS